MDRSNKPEPLTCGVCLGIGSDLKIAGCGCTFHAYCIPTNLITASPSSLANPVDVCHCPGCRRRLLERKSEEVLVFYLVPLTFQDLEKSIQLRRKSPSAGSSTKNNTSKRGSSDDDDTIEIANEIETTEAVYTNVTAQRWKEGSVSISRTGRWTNEEVAYADYIVAAFDKGALPLPNGTKLNHFLGDILMCKASRLTKKMKNANLTRSFVGRPLNTDGESSSSSQASSLALLERDFLASLPSEISRWEISFNVVMQWRTNLLKLFQHRAGKHRIIQAGDWISSVDNLEARAHRAKSALKAMRRRNGKLAPLLLDHSGGAKRPRFSSSHITEDQQDQCTSDSNSSDALNLLDEPDPVVPALDDYAFLDHIMQGEDTPCGTTTLSTTAAAVLEESSLDSSPNQDSSAADASKADYVYSVPPRHRSATFFDMISMYMVENNMPFQHASCWVPSIQSGGSSTASEESSEEGNARLCHAGYITRNDIARHTRTSMEGFGESCSSLSFRPGEGLPGRVYVSGQAQFEIDMTLLDPLSCPQATAAYFHGIKTAAAVPFQGQGVGRMVLIVYSCNTVNVDISSLNAMAATLAQYAPKPAWQLVIDITTPIGEDEVRHQSSNETCPFDKMISKALDVPNPPPLPLVYEVSTSSSSSQLSSPLMLGATASLLNADREDETLPFSQFRLEDFGTGVNSDDGTVNRMLNLIEKHGSRNHFDPSTIEALSLRSLLLEPLEKLPPTDKDIVETLKASFADYSGRPHERGDLGLYTLLLNDWICLKPTRIATAGAVTPATSQLLHPSTNIRNNKKARPMMSRHSYSALPTPPPMAHASNLLATPRSRSLPKLADDDAYSSTMNPATAAWYRSLQSSTNFSAAPSSTPFF